MLKHHIENFFRWKCASDILALDIFPNAKEVTESLGAFFAVRNHVISPTKLKELSDSNIALVSVGDGNTPRTAATFAFRTAWTCYSIDPRLKKTDWPIKRLTCLKRRVEEDTLDLTSFEQVIIVMVHSHATIKNTLKHIKGRKIHLVCIPCCVLQDIPDKSFIGYKDSGIWSEKNDVKIWLNIVE
jgi:hypothetical protein